MTNPWDRFLLPRLVTVACASKPMRSARAKAVALAHGDVLELGVGAGPNLSLYDARSVTRVVGIEPNALLRERAAAAVHTVPVELTGDVAESLPFAEGAFDSVVCTFTLCTVPDPAAALREVRRVLRPGGRFVYCEHGSAPDAQVARWQRRIEPLWSKLAGGCHLTRNVETSLREAGFSVDSRGAEYLRKTPRFVGWHWWGQATR